MIFRMVYKSGHPRVRVDPHTSTRVVYPDAGVDRLVIIIDGSIGLRSQVGRPGKRLRLQATVGMGVVALRAFHVWFALVVGLLFPKKAGTLLCSLFRKSECIT